MVKEISDLKKSLENKSKRNKNINQGFEIMKEIISDFDSISEKVKYSIPTKKIHEIAAKNSKSYENRIAIGFNESGFNYSCIKEVSKQKILQEYKERNKNKWQEINNVGLDSLIIIAWGVAFRRKAIPVFLDDNELRMFGYSSGLIEIKNYDNGEEKYYDNEVYPPPFPGNNTDKRWYGIKYTRGMRHQWSYLLRILLGGKLELSKLPNEGINDFMFAILKHPEILTTIFENVRKLEKTHEEKIQKMESEMLSLYEELSEEKQKEAMKRMSKSKELDNVRKAIGNYTEVYLYANECRRGGMSLDKGLKMAIENLKDSNIQLQKLIIKKNYDIVEVIDSLHNSYYKTKYKQFNDF